VPIFSRRFSLWTRLYDRLLLEPTSDVRVTPMVSEVVVPVLNADAILETPKATGAGGDLSASAGAFVPFFTVPANEEWHLIEIFTASFSAATLAVVAFTDTWVSVTTSGTGAINKNLRDYTLREGEQVGLLTTGAGGDSDRNMYMVYTVIDLGI